MISVIICSINKIFATQVQVNIAETIGVPFEIIIIDNTINPKSITRVYNQGASTAIFDILCFVHEDVLFTTQNWGSYLVTAFLNDAELGLIGVAGSKYKSKVPSGWFTGIRQYDCCNISHLNTFETSQKVYFNPDYSKKMQSVVVLDGVFLVSTKHVWENIRKKQHFFLKGYN